MQLGSGEDVRGSRGLSPIVETKKPFSSYAYKSTLSLLLLGFAAGLLGAGAIKYGLLPFPEKRYLYFCFFNLAWLFLGGFGAMIVTKILFSVVSGGKELGTLDSLKDADPCNTRMEKIVLGGYLISIAFAAFFSGGWLGSCLGNLLTGRIFLIIGEGALNAY